MPGGSSYRASRRASGGGRRDGLSRGKDRDLGVLGQHHAHDLLQCEQVDARSPTLEVVAGATPLAGIEGDVVGVVIAAERERETVDCDSIELSRVAIRLLDLADQGTVHRRSTSVARGGRSRGRRPVMHLDRWWRSCADSLHRETPAVTPDSSMVYGAFVPSRPKSS